MSNGPQVNWLPDGRRLHLHHGPIDLIVDIWGKGRSTAFEAAVARFDGVLQELVDELPHLRKPFDRRREFDGVIARKMQKAVAPFAAEFVTPMAAVAGAVADDIAAEIAGIANVDKAYVNNGGDVALVLRKGQSLRMDVGAGVAQCDVGAEMPVRGVATSGWRGRSLSLGIADAVTVLAADAATADAAATMICNQVNLPNHPAVSQRAASEMQDDSDLGARQVTCAVGELRPAECAQAITKGREMAENLCSLGIITGAMICLQGHTEVCGMSTFLAKS